MGKPKVIVFSGYGLNSEEETAYAFEVSGGKADVVHINDLIGKKYRLSDYQIAAIPGGFAYGDDTGAGNGYANRLKNHLWPDIIKFIEDGKLVIGICNGFQILVNLGLLPALKMRYGTREMGLMPNKIPRYTVRFVDLKCESHQSPWLKGITSLSIPVSNGEGKLYASPDVLAQINKRHLVAFRYYKGEMCRYLGLPASPNGSIDDIAGVVDETGRILGLMPHPERAMFFNQLPNWPYLKEKCLRSGEKLPVWGPGLKVFQNGIKYFRNEK
ncbi:phosphoribosylformylglycinamidine synthase subunit PurQ [Patescibacteria group bacterium]|nr:phosphoribosylformylglycinamidine synthase subunit PurQ [Patescibacteria group bacterium]